jgi:hypothetical protein
MAFLHSQMVTKLTKVCNDYPLGKIVTFLDALFPDSRQEKCNLLGESMRIHQSHPVSADCR